MIQINQQKQSRVKIFDKHNNAIGICENEWEFADVLLQIYREKTDGYSYQEIDENDEPIKSKNKISASGRIKGSPYYKLNIVSREMMGF